MVIHILDLPLNAYRIYTDKEITFVQKNNSFTAKMEGVEVPEIYCETKEEAKMELLGSIAFFKLAEKASALSNAKLTKPKWEKEFNSLKDIKVERIAKENTRDNGLGSDRTETGSTELQSENEERTVPVCASA